MDCRGAFELLVRGEMAAAAPHLAGCEACRRRALDLADTSEALRAHIAQETARVDFSRFTAEVLRRVEAERPAPLPEKALVWLTEALKFHPVRMALAAAAALALAVGAPAAFMNGVDNTCVVRSLDFTIGGGMVYQAHDNMTVIWLEEG